MQYVSMWLCLVTENVFVLLKWCYVVMSSFILSIEHSFDLPLFLFALNLAHSALCVGFGRLAFYLDVQTGSLHWMALSSNVVWLTVFSFHVSLPCLKVCFLLMLFRSKRGHLGDGGSSECRRHCAEVVLQRPLRSSHPSSPLWRTKGRTQWVVRWQQETPPASVILKIKYAQLSD